MNKNRLSKYAPSIIWVFFALLIGVICFGTGLFVKNWYHVKYDSEVKIFDIINLCITILIAGFLPFIITKTIETKTKVGEIASAEIERYRTHVDSTHDFFQNLYKNGSLEASDKLELVLRGDFFDDNYDLLCTTISGALNNRADSYLKKLSTAQIRYWQTITDREMLDTATILVSRKHQLYERKYYVEINQALIDLIMFIQK